MGTQKHGPNAAGTLSKHPTFNKNVVPVAVFPNGNYSSAVTLLFRCSSVRVRPTISPDRIILAFGQGDVSRLTKLAARNV